MDGMIGILAILLGLLFAGLGIYRILIMVEAVKRLRIETEARYNQGQADLIHLENQAETLRKRIEERKADLKNLQERLKQANSIVSLQTREKRRAFWITASPRADSGTEHRATIFCSRLAGDWKTGREHVLWAKDEDQARRAFETRFPASSGYEIKDVRKAPWPL